MLALRSPSATVFLFSSLLLLQLPACSSFQPLDFTYPSNPVAAETPVYRDDKGDIVIDIARLSEPLALPVTVYHGTSYETIDLAHPLATTEHYTFVWKEGDNDQQHFFKLVSASGASAVVAERQIYLRGTNNTRDLGGYKTSKGRIVKWGMLYRSDDLHDLKKTDWNYWRTLHLGTLIDFREPEVWERKPDQLPKSDSLAELHLPVYDTGTTRQAYRKLLQDADPDTYDTEEILIRNNEIYVTQYTPTFAQAFDMILNQEQPMLYHCSAGKDRTGFMSAMLLLTLGVPRETVMRDYMASNYYQDRSIRRRARLAPLIGINSRVALPLLQVRVVYLQAAFQMIEERYGSIDNYIREGLCISDQEREKLKQKYLEEE